MNASEYANYDGLGLAELIRTGQVSPEEVAETARRVIDLLNPQLNAVIRRTDEPTAGAAPDEAPGADADADPGVAPGAASPDAPFAEVPFLLKDSLQVKGNTMTFGSVLLKDHVAEWTHEVARRMFVAGVRDLGRTNLCEFGLLPHTESALHGAARNPWNPDYSPGGSSGGSAVAVASGMVPLAHAADGGGSIRIPASCCGLFGLKPSRGRNPSAVWGYDGSLAVNHVLSRTVRDSAAMLDTICGPRPREPWILPRPDRPYRDVITEPPPRCRIAFTTTDFTGNAAHPDCARAVELMAHQCEELGHAVEEAKPPIDGAAFAEAFTQLWAQGAGLVYRQAREALQGREEIPAPLRSLLGNQTIFRLLLALARRDGKPVLERFTRGLAAIDRRSSPADLEVAQLTLKQMERQVTDFLGTYDLLLTPVLSEPPHPIGTFDQRWSFQEMRHFLNRLVAYTPIANTTGFPAMSVPTFWTAERLPIGTHFVAPLGREDLLLQLAAQLEDAYSWKHRHPAVSAWHLGLESSHRS
ncbi:MAG: amidase [Spirochaetaceae bacterium]